MKVKIWVAPPKSRQIIGFIICLLFFIVLVLSSNINGFKSFCNLSDFIIFYYFFIVLSKNCIQIAYKKIFNCIQKLHTKKVCL